MRRFCDLARGRWRRTFALPFLLLLALPGQLAAQDSPWRLSPPPVDDLTLSPAGRVFSERSCSKYRLLPGKSHDCEPWMASADLTTGPPLRMAQADAEKPLAAEAPEPNRLLGTLIPLATWGFKLADSLVGYEKVSWHVNYEQWFGSDTRDGGADKASHFADFYIVAKEMEFIYRKLGYSENAARWWGLGIAVSTGVVNEVADGFTHHGFSWEDLAMDTLGAGTAVLLSVTRTEDLFGIRTSHVVSASTYTHDVYAADLKLSGVGRRLGVNLGPLRWLLLSVTYGSKGYRVSPAIELQRQLGFEIGLNFQQILNDLKVTDDTWWGHLLHLVGDNVRFPYTAFGMRVDLNRGKWHGPNNGNYP